MTNSDSAPNGNKPILRALSGEVLDSPPIWLMRQAGRFLPEYRRLRKSAGSFLSLCYTPELAAEVTLQPIRRFGFDAAILFADILLIAQALGSDLDFLEGKGPRLSRIASFKDVSDLYPTESIDEVLEPVYQTVGILAQELPRETALIGFAGAPWTVATYMIAGRGVPGQHPAKAFMAEQRGAFELLMNRLADATIHYLNRQIEAGAEVVMLFDSWAGSLGGDAFKTYVETQTREIVSALKQRNPDTPVIVFPRGAGDNLANIAVNCGADCVSVDESTDAKWASRQIGNNLCVQGNLHPDALARGGKTLIRSAKAVADGFAGRPHIFNLGHGIYPHTDTRNVELLMEVVRNYRPPR
ncbi:MAG: uroporphyrinogen decarboxylase [Rhodobacteraceae bacterium]|nr:uroporphyrinogen decarboxylase [Paracoccaceae bacterium]